MANFDAFNPKPAPDAMDWRGLNTAIDGFVGQQERRQTRDRGLRASELFAKGEATYPLTALR